MNVKGLIPIGSVVNIKNAEKRIMIIGIAPVANNQRYDYVGIVYPEGYIDNKHFYLFNHKDIESVSFFGFFDAEAQIFMSKVDKFVNDDKN